MEDLSKLPNIGKVCAKELQRAGIGSFEQLKKEGSIGAYIKIRGIDPSACYNKLYAIEGAIRGIRWHDIPPVERSELKKAADELLNNVL